jgi:hypothetical protein
MDELKKLPKLVPNKQYYIDMANDVPKKIKTLNDYGNKLVHIGPMIQIPILGVDVEVPFRYIFETPGIYQYGSGLWNSNMGFSSDTKSAFAVDKNRWENVIGEPAPDFDDDTLKKNSMAELAKEAYAIAQSIFDDADSDSTLKIISKKLLSPNNGKELVFLGPGDSGDKQLTGKYDFSYYDLFQYSTSSHEWIVGASGSSTNAYYAVTKTIWEEKFGISAPKNPNINQEEETKYPETDEEIEEYFIPFAEAQVNGTVPKFWSNNLSVNDVFLYGDSKLIYMGMGFDEGNIYDTLKLHEYYSDGGGGYNGLFVYDKTENTWQANALGNTVSSHYALLENIWTQIFGPVPEQTSSETENETPKEAPNADNPVDADGKPNLAYLQKMVKENPSGFLDQMKNGYKNIQKEFNTTNIPFANSKGEHMIILGKGGKPSLKDILQINKKKIHKLEMNNSDDYEWIENYNGDSMDYWYAIPETIWDELFGKHK